MVHAFPPDSFGGTELHVQTLSGDQTARHEVGVFTRRRTAFQASSGGGGDPPLAGPGVRMFVFEHGAGGTSFLERTRFAPAEEAFRDVLSAFRPDVVHAHHLSGLSAGILGLAADAGARVVLTIHDHALACPRGQRIRPDLDPCPVLDRDRCARCVRPAWIEAARSPNRLAAILGILRRNRSRQLFGTRDAWVHAQLGRVRAFIAPSASAAELFLEYFPAARERLSVIPHGTLQPASRPPMPPFGAAGPLRIGYFGALLPTKGVLVLADAAGRLGPGSDIRVVMHGAGDPRIVAGLIARGRGNVEIAGSYRPADLGDRMAGVHAVAVPSLWPETFSIVTREAWAHGRPVLASAIGALVEAAGPRGDRAGLVPPGDVPAWTEAMRRLASDPDWFAGLAGPHAPESFESMRSAIEACYTGPR